MTRLAALALIGLATAAMPAAWAQTGAAQKLTTEEPAPVPIPIDPGTLNLEFDRQPLVIDGNWALTIWAPAASPGDSGAAYRTFEGQPMTGRESVLAPHSGYPGKSAP